VIVAAGPVRVITADQARTFGVLARPRIASDALPAIWAQPLTQSFSSVGVNVNLS
jgi:hypothetical protein